MQKCNDNKNILIWDNETGECLGFIAQIKGRLNLQDDIIKDQQTTISRLEEENEQLKETNEKLQRDLDKTREDLNYFANLKVSAMRGSDCGHDRCYVTSMQKKGNGV